LGCEAAPVTAGDECQVYCVESYWGGFATQRGASPLATKSLAATTSQARHHNELGHHNKLDFHNKPNLHHKPGSHIKRIHHDKLTTGGGRGGLTPAP